jgi:hypothetical protein
VVIFVLRREERSILTVLDNISDRSDREGTGTGAGAGTGQGREGREDRRNGTVEMELIFHHCLGIWVSG